MMRVVGRRQLIKTGSFLVFMCVGLQLLNTVSFITKDYSHSAHTENVIVDRSKENNQITTVKQSNTQVHPKSIRNISSSSSFEKFLIEPSVRMRVDHREALIYGHSRNYTTYLTIGIPTVQRQGVSYLDNTLDSLIKNSDKNEHKQITIVILIADKDHKIIDSRAKDLYKKYKFYVDSGLIQIIHPDHQYYPDFQKLERTFNDSETRVEWRCKQNIDYAYLFLYSRNLSQYYLQLEDDVISANNYIREIRNFVGGRPLKPKWFCLQFSHLGFIGKLFRSSDLKLLAEYILMFFAEQPGDLLVNYLKKIKTQWKDILRKPSLFQHQGVISSLKDKKQMLVDKSFVSHNSGTSTSKKKYYTQNPNADIYTTIDVYKNNKPEYAYDVSDRMFWGILPNRGDYFRISFHSPQNITHLYIKTGSPNTPNDILQDGAVKISLNDPAKQSTQEACDTSQMIGTFKKGEFDSIEKNLTIPLNVGCVSIEVTNAQKNWVIIREISVVTATKK